MRVDKIRSDELDMKENDESQGERNTIKKTRAGCG